MLQWYACFYKSDTGKVNEIKAEEMTLSFVCNHFPREMIRHLETKRQCQIYEVEQGIYYVSDVLFRIQVIVQKQLSEKKIAKGKSLAQIADELEESILPLYKKAMGE